MQQHENLYRYSLEYLNTLHQEAEAYRLTKHATTGYQFRKLLASSLNRLAQRLEPKEVVPLR
jgi:hypothetical protein